MCETKDRGYIVGGIFYSENVNIGPYLIEKNENDLNYYDSMLIKYDKNGKVEWASAFGGNSEDTITSISETQDGGFIVVGEFRSDSFSVGDYIFNNKSTSNGYRYNGFTIKYYFY